MKDVMNLAALGQLQLISNLSNPAYHPVRPIKTGLELLSSLLLQSRLSVWLQTYVDQVPYLKLSLYPTPVGIQLLLVLCCNHVILESSEDVLTLLDPILGSRSLAGTKHHINKR